jgi:hypothetical protein
MIADYLLCFALLCFALLCFALLCFQQLEQGCAVLSFQVALFFCVQVAVTKDPLCSVGFTGTFQAASGPGERPLAAPGLGVTVTVARFQGGPGASG